PVPPEAAKTMLIADQGVTQAAKQAEAAKLDIQTLKSGDVIEGRYKYIDRIGRGAFGTVLLMEDTVVDERLILKFLNPNVSRSEERRVGKECRSRWSTGYIKKKKTVDRQD